jgi:triosephosphate isomerase
MQRPVLAANWKLNHGPTAARAFIERFMERYPPRTDRTVIFFPPALSLASVAALLRDRAEIGTGIQNIWIEDKGAFTGENSALIARDAGARYVLIGHSERRHVFGETDAETAKKCAAAVRNGLTPMLCVGETLEERDAHHTESVVLRQLRAGLAELTPDAVRGMAVAYEPVWAIGTGRNASPDDAATVHGILRGALKGVIGSAADRLPILYGGSVNPGNAPALLAAPGVDGLLVGGASLDADTWATLCST